jgi:hypothetical protein
MAPKVTPVVDNPVVKMRKGDKAALVRREKLRYPEMSEAQIAKRVGCDPAHVHRVLAKFLGQRTEDDLREFQEQRVNVFDAITMRSLMSITDSKLTKSSAAALMMVAGTAHDKSQVLRGQATGIDVHILANVEDAIRARHDAEQAAFQRAYRERLVNPT